MRTTESIRRNDHPEIEHAAEGNSTIAPREVNIAEPILVIEGGPFVHEDVRAGVNAAKIQQYLAV